MTRKNTVLIILVAAAILVIYKFKTPSTIAQEAILEIQQIDAPDQHDLGTTAPETAVKSDNIQTSTQKKLSTLKEILTSKNDNDPRMDTELKNLSGEDKDALIKMYQNLKSEKLNDKGTIVFLVGRELSRPEDIEFLKNVLSEEPCLSLENCGVTNSQSDPHLDSVNDVSLNYPQVVALNRIKTFIQNNNLETMNPTILSQLSDAVRIGENSKIGMVKNRSKEISNLLTKIKK